MNIYLDRFTERVGSRTRMGGLSKVYECADLAINQTVAIKVTEIATPIRKLTFDRETQSLQKLRHPNIVEMIDFGITGDFGIIAMPWAEQNLSDYLNGEGKELAWQDRFREIVIPLISAIEYAHKLGVDHRDLKSNNVLMFDGIPKLADWGSAKIYSEGESDQTTLRWNSGVYTPLISGSPMQHDVYSFAVLMVEILTCEKPKNILEVKQLIDLSKIFSDDTKKILHKCLEEDPERRFSSAIDIKQELDNRDRKLSRNKISQNCVLTAILTPEIQKKLHSYLYSMGNQYKDYSQMFENQEIYVSPLLKNDVGFKRDEFWLLGDNFKILVKVDHEVSSWRMLKFVDSEAEDLEYFRSRSFILETLNLPWEFAVGKPKNPQKSKLGLEKFELAFSDWLDRGQVNLSESTSAELEVAELVGLWRRTLDARERMSTQGFRKLSYSQIEASESIVEIILAEEIDDDLTGSFWKIPFGKDVTGEVTYHSGNELQLFLLRTPQGKPSKEGYLLPDIDGKEANSLKRQRAALDAISTSTSVNGTIGQILVSPELLKYDFDVEISSWVNSNLDESKRNAVKKALASKDLTLIKGPPGTGKTSFIAEYVAQEIRRKADVRILLVSQTHVALDNAIEKIKDSGILEIVRIARNEDPRVSEIGKRFLLENQLQIWKKDLQKKSNLFAQKLGNSAGLSAEQTNLVLKLWQLENVTKEIESLENTESLSEDFYDDSVDEDSISYLKQAEDRLKELQDLKFLLEEDLIPLTHDYGLTIPRNIDAVTLQHFQEVLLGESKVSKQFLEVLETQAAWINRIGSSSQVGEIFMKTRNIVAGTCLGFMSSRDVRDIEFDICIIDEASKASLTEALVPMVRSRKWVLVGDSRQLSAADHNLEKPESKTILQSLQLVPEDVNVTMFDRLEQLLPPERISSLDTQYRMRDEIGELVSDCFYESQLSSSGPKAIPGLELICPPVLWMDTNIGKDFGNEHRTGLSYSNRDEMTVILKKMQSIDGAIKKGHIKIERKLKILIIAPYSGQLTQAHEVIRNLKGFSFNVEFNSIDAVQGREADIVFFSTVRNNSSGNVGFLSNSNWRRINVALSRARFSLIIVGNADFWTNSNSALSEVLAFIKSRNSLSYQIGSANVD